MTSLFVLLYYENDLSFTVTPIRGLKLKNAIGQFNNGDVVRDT